MRSHNADLPAVDVRVRLRPLALHKRLRLLKLHPLQENRMQPSAAATESKLGGVENVLSHSLMPLVCTTYISTHTLWASEAVLGQRTGAGVCYYCADAGC